MKNTVMIEEAMNSEWLELPVTTKLCPRCKRNEEDDPHECPFQSDVNDDREFQCTCCADCTSECAQDI